MHYPLINGDFQIWQRGTTFSFAGFPSDHLRYTADRWNVDWPHDAPEHGLKYDFGLATISRQSFALGQTDVPGEPKYFLRWEQHKPSSPNTYFRDLSQQIEDVRTFAGQQVTLSCWLRSDRPTTVRLVTEQFFGSSGGSPPEFTEAPQPFNVTKVWQRYSYSAVLKSVSGKVIGAGRNDSLNFIVSQKGQSAVDRVVLDIADCQIEPGTLTPFHRRTFAQELLDAERYFQKSYDHDIPPGTPNVWVGTVNTRQISQYHVTPIALRRSMRVRPRVALYNPSSGDEGGWRSLERNVKVAAGDVGMNYFHVDVTDFGVPGEPLAGHWTAEAEF